MVGGMSVYCLNAENMTVKGCELIFMGNDRGQNAKIAHAPIDAESVCHMHVPTLQNECQIFELAEQSAHQANGGLLDVAGYRCLPSTRLA